MVMTRETTVGAIVAEDFRTAAVFQRLGIDFCCRGNRTLDEVCRDKEIRVETLLDELASVSGPGGAPRFNIWETGLLIDYIIGNHHAYVRRSAPLIVAHARKVAAVHGARHPELGEIRDRILRVLEELEQHMEKEERVLFPALKSGGAGWVTVPIAAMEREHDEAGRELEVIRELSGNYTPPEDACTTYRVFFKELEEFESDLHLHVHLENNVLFPRFEHASANAPANASDGAACVV